MWLEQLTINEVEEIIQQCSLSLRQTVVSV